MFLNFFLPPPAKKKEKKKKLRDAVPFLLLPPREAREMAEKRRSPCAMSVKAHAFSVEALIGAEKRRRTSGEDAASPGYEDGTDVSDLTGSPGPRADRACTSDRGSEAECASDGSRK